MNIFTSFKPLPHRECSCSALLAQYYDSHCHAKKNIPRSNRITFLILLFHYMYLFASYLDLDFLIQNLIFPQQSKLPFLCLLDQKSKQQKASLQLQFLIYLLLKISYITL